MTVIGSLDDKGTPQPTIASLYLWLKGKGYYNNSIERYFLMAIDSHFNYEEWLRIQLELDRKNVFKCYYSNEDINVFKHHMAQAESDYVAGYIVYAIDYLLVQFKIN